MNYIIYVSTSTRLYNNDELADLLSKSRINNAKANITGMLLYSMGTFFQVLEGEEEKLTALYEKIKKDERHRGLIKLKSGKLANRLFPDWSMGFKTSVTESVAHLRGFVNPEKKEFLQGRDFYHPAINMLQTFAVNNSLRY
jgi:hypothetical protein